MSTADWTAAPHAVRRVLIRASWATVNIGDVAHSPALVKVLLDAAPDAEIALWPVTVGDRERAMIAAMHPGLRVVEGDLDPTGRASTPELADAVERADVLVHGPAAGPYLADLMPIWRDVIGKPYGYAGITVDPVSPPAAATLAQLRLMAAALPETFATDPVRPNLDAAEFVYVRETTSLSYLRRQGIAVGRAEFGPDATFAYDHRDDVAGDALLARSGLRAGGYACFVPRLRYAPYPAMIGRPVTRETQWRDAVNAGTVGDDLGALAAGIAEWVRSTGTYAFVVPEMIYAPDLARTELLPRLAADVRNKVVVLDEYWPLEVATSVYARARAVISMDCHSPILAAAAGVPTLYLRQPTETSKGQMFADLGAPGTVVEISDGAEAVRSAVARIVADEPTVKREVAGLASAARARLHEVATTILTGRST